MNKLSLKIEDKVNHFNFSKIIQNEEFPQLDSEIIDKPTIANETKISLTNLFSKVNHIDTVSDKIEEFLIKIGH